jgi:hypothetical protein
MSNLAVRTVTAGLYRVNRMHRIRTRDNEQRLPTFCTVTPCCLIHAYRRFGETLCLHIQDPCCGITCQVLVLLRQTVGNHAPDYTASQTGIPQCKAEFHVLLHFFNTAFSTAGLHRGKYAVQNTETRCVDSSLWACEAGWLHEQFQAFRRVLVPPSAGSGRARRLAPNATLGTHQ